MKKVLFLLISVFYFPHSSSVPSFNCSSSTLVDNFWVRMHTGFVIILKSPREIEQLRKSNAIVSEVLRKLRELVAPEVITRDLEQVANEIILSRGAVSAFKGYRGFSGSIC